MTGTVVTHKTQVGQSGTAANNFTIRTIDDGSLRISRGNAGAETSDVLVIDANGNFSTAPVLGLGQTWQNMAASRAMNTTYTNTTGMPIQLIVSFYNGSSNMIVTVNGAGVHVGTSVLNGSIAHSSIIIPVGATYSVSGSASFSGWWELR